MSEGETPDLGRTWFSVQGKGRFLCSRVFMNRQQQAGNEHTWTTDAWCGQPPPKNAHALYVRLSRETPLSSTNSSTTRTLTCSSHFHSRDHQQCSPWLYRHYSSSVESPKYDLQENTHTNSMFLAKNIPWSIKSIFVEYIPPPDKNNGYIFGILIRSNTMFWIKWL